MTHKPLSEVENGEEGKTRSQELSNELNLLNSESFKSDEGSYEQRASSIAPKAYEMEGSCSSKINNTKNDTNLMSNCSNKDMFLDSYTTSCQPSDLMGNYPLHITDTLPTNSNSCHWFSQTARPFDINSNSEFTITSNVMSILPPTTTSFLPSTSFCYKPSLGVPSEDISAPSFGLNGPSYWEASASNNSNGSNNTSDGSRELTTTSSKNSVLSSWELTEEAKWSEYLHNPMLMLAAPESLCNQIRPATHLIPDNTLGAIILPDSKNQQQQQQQQQSQNSCIFSKDVQKLTAAFGHI